MKIFLAAATILTATAVTPVHAKLPSSVSDIIDQTANPCTDFYQYACGNWIKANALGPSDSTKQRRSAALETKELAIQEIIQEKPPVIGEFWDSCVGQSTREGLGANPLQPVLNKLTKVTTREDVMRLAGELSRTGGKFATDYFITSDGRNITSNAMYLSYPELVLGRQNYVDNASFAGIEGEFRTYISTLFKLSEYNPHNVNDAVSGGTIPVDPVPATYFEDTVIAVETKLATVVQTMAVEDGPDAYYHPAKIGELMAKYPLALGAYLTGAALLQDSTLTADSTVILSYSGYFEAAEKALASFTSKDLATYVAFLYIHNRVSNLDSKFYDAYFKFVLASLGVQAEQLSPETTCKYRLQELLPDLLGEYFFRKVLGEEGQAGAQLLVEAVESALSNRFPTLSWLDDSTRREALAKLGKVTNFVGKSSVTKSYPFTLHRDSYFENVETIVLNDFKAKLEQLDRPVDRNGGSIWPTDLDAFYMPLQNKLVVPAGALQSPTFDAKSHLAQNFGSIGSIVGRELTHGFDSYGHFYDGDGNTRDWWSASTTDAFDKRASCIKSQYSTFAVKGQTGAVLGNVDGDVTSNENIADNGGFSLAWDAYHAYAKVATASDAMSDLEANQTLFLSFAQTWCSVTTDEDLTNQLMTDPHSPEQWRVNGVAMNSEHFGKAFNCAAGTPMNPTTKCNVW